MDIVFYFVSNYHILRVNSLDIILLLFHGFLLPRDG